MDKKIKEVKKVVCPACQGSGTKDEDKSCPECGGAGVK